MVRIPIKVNGRILASPRLALPQASITLNLIREYICPLLIEKKGDAWGAVTIDGAAGVLPMISYVKGATPFETAVPIEKPLASH